MYICGNCHRNFARFKTAGQCPLCGVWAEVRCTGCGYVASAQVFINNSNRCPRCGKLVAVDAAGSSWLSELQGPTGSYEPSVKAQFVIIGIALVIAVCVAGLIANWR